MEINFDNNWAYENMGNSRTFFTPLNREIRRQNQTKKQALELNRRGKNEYLSDDSGRP